MFLKPRALGLWLVSLLLCGCASLPISPEESSEAITSESSNEVISALAVRFQTHRHSSGPNRGTAIPLGNNRILTSRHLLPDDAFGVTVEIDGNLHTTLPTLYGELGGTPVQYRVVGSGGCTSQIDQDWAILEVGGGPKLRDPHELGVIFDPERSLKIGEPAFLVGFHHPLEDGGPKVICATVQNPPFGILVPSSVVCVGTHSTDTYHGVSGGPLVVQDGKSLVVVGIYRGMRILEVPPFTISAVHVVCRLPTEVR